MTPGRRGCREPATRPAAPQLGRAVGAAHHRWKVLLGHKGPGIQGSRLHSPLSPAIRTAHSQMRGVPPPGKSCLESTRSPAVRYERRQVQARAEPSSRPIVGTRARRPLSAPPTSDSRVHRAADKTQAAAKLDFRISNSFDKLRHMFAFIRTLDIYM